MTRRTADDENAPRQDSISLIALSGASPRIIDRESLVFSSLNSLARLLRIFRLKFKPSALQGVDKTLSIAYPIDIFNYY